MQDYGSNNYHIQHPKFVEGESSFGRMLMLASDWRDFQNGTYTHPNGSFDAVRAAKAGVRVFVFVDDSSLAASIESWLKHHPEAEPFVTGTWDDLEALKRRSKAPIKIVDNVGWGMINPLTNVVHWDERHTPHLAISRVTGDQFRRVFGQKSFTSRFPKEGTE